MKAGMMESKRKRSLMNLGTFDVRVRIFPKWP